MELITYLNFIKKKILIFFLILIFLIEFSLFLQNIFTIFILIQVLKTIIVVIPILIAVAFLTLFERKVMAAIQRRRGPNVVGLFGMLQPFADGLKLLIKETILPSKANQIIFIIAPILTIFLSFISWAIIPFNKYIVYSDINVGILYLFAVSSLGVYGIIMSGWSSNSRYAFLGTLRATAQMISYEVSIGLIIINVLLLVGSLNISLIIESQKIIWFVFPLFPLFLLFYLSALAETNRPPFDLPEAEAELVAGYFVEYSAMGFAQFFLGENINIILMCYLIVIFFFGGWYSFFNLTFFYNSYFIDWIVLSFKLLILLFSFVWVRMTFPRYRYDQLMRLGWKIFLPLSLAFVVLNASIVICFNLL